MRKIMAIFLFLSLSTAYADIGAGRFQILGVGMDAQPFIVVFAKYIDSGYQENLCAQTDWWWPAGTTHAWWIDRTDKELYAMLLALSQRQGIAYIGGHEEPQAFGAGVKCKIDHAASH